MPLLPIQSPDCSAANAVQTVHFNVLIFPFFNLAGHLFILQTIILIGKKLKIKSQTYNSSCLLDTVLPSRWKTLHLGDPLSAGQIKTGESNGRESSVVFTNLTCTYNRWTPLWFLSGQGSQSYFNTQISYLYVAVMFQNSLKQKLTGIMTLMTNFQITHSTGCPQ